MVSNTFDNIRALILEGNIRISEHGYDEIAADGLLARELVEGVEAAEVIEDYPDYHKGALCIAAPTDWRGAYSTRRVGNSCRPLKPGSV